MLLNNIFIIHEHIDSFEYLSASFCESDIRVPP